MSGETSNAPLIDVPAAYFAPQSVQPRNVTVRWNAFEGMFEVRGDGVLLRLPAKKFTIEPRLGRDARAIRFTDSGRCEVAADPAFDAVIDAWRIYNGGSTLYRFVPLAVSLAFTLVLLGSIGWALVHYGLPWAARKVAFALPADVMRQVGEQSLASLDASTLKPTKLTHERQLAVQSRFSAFLAKVGDITSYRLEFRAMPEPTPNAFALPSGVIVVTDDLVQLAANDDEIIGVLAHECGHIVHRHSLRGLLQNSAVIVLIALVTGDSTSASTFGSALPQFLLQNQFSREFEREADFHAVDSLRKAGLDPANLAHMLERLAKQQGEGNSKVLGYLSTHPPTPERIRAISGKK